MVKNQPTPKQLRILQLLADGHNYASIAELMGTSRQAVKNDMCRNNPRKSLGLFRRMEILLGLNVGDVRKTRAVVEGLNADWISLSNKEK